MKQLKRFFTASRREWPYAFAARNILLLGLAAMTLCAAVALVNPPIPAYEELTAVTGTYQGLERQSGGSYLLVLTTEDGYTDRCLIDDFAGFDRYAFLAAVKPGDPIALGCGPDDYRTVMELTAAGETFLSYEKTRQAAWRNNYLGLIVTPAVTAAAMAACWVWMRLRGRKGRAAKAAPPSVKAPLPAKAPPAGYPPAERGAVEAYIQRALGTPERVYYDATQSAHPVDVAVIPPTQQENFFRLVTIGMGARRMEVPPELRETNQAFAELVVFLPPDWNPDSGDPWPFQWLRRAAETPWLHAGTVFSGRVGDYTAVLVSWPALREGCSGRMMLESGKVINFYQLYPLLPDEDAYRKLRGVQRLWDRMKEYEVSPIVASRRESCCAMAEWFDQEIAPFAMEEKDGVWYGWLHLKGLGSHYRNAAYPRDAGGWRELCRRFCGKYGWQGLALHSQRDLFYVTAQDEDLLRPFLLAFHDFCDVPEQAASLMREET